MGDVARMLRGRLRPPLPPPPAERWGGGGSSVAAGGGALAGPDQGTPNEAIAAGIDLHQQRAWDADYSIDLSILPTVEETRALFRHSIAGRAPVCAG